MRLICLAMVAVMLVGSVPALSHTLKEVERQVEEAERKLREQQAAEARMATLTLQSDHACRLSIDGSDRQDIGPEETVSLKLEPGDQLIGCVSTRFEGLKVQQIESLSLGSKRVVMLTFGEQVARREREEAIKSRFQQLPDGNYDSEQKVIWAPSENGFDIDWHGARNHCASKGAGWRLPTVAQLQSLMRFTGPMKRHNLAYWSSETAGSSEAFIVTLNGGDRIALGMAGHSARALCVRSR